MKRSLFLILIIILALCVIGLIAVLWNLSPAGPSALTPTPLEAQALPTRTPLPPQPPVTVYRSPAPGEEQALDGPIVIGFDQPMDRDSVEEAFSIEPEVAGDFSWEENDLVFTPAKPLARGESYQVTVAESARSAAGLPLKEPVTFAFRTVGYLEVTDVQPAPDTEEVERDAIVTVFFNRPVVPLTSIAQQAELPHPLVFMPPVTGEGQWLNTSIYTFKPDDGFKPATTYKARVKAGLTDTTGGVLAEDYTWTFTTVMPRVLSTYPRNKNIHVGPSQTITVTFNQPMDHTSAQEHFSLKVEATGEEVPGDFHWEDDETMVFVPAEDLELDTVYAGKVAKGAKAAEAKGETAKDYSWYFTTVSLPYIISTDPADGETEVKPYTSLKVEFSSPMDRDTLMPNLTIVPTVTKVYSYWRRYDTTLRLSFNPEPSTAYTVTFGADMAGRYGHKLGQPYTVHFTTDALPPQVHLHSPGRVGTYNAYTTTMIYVTYRNVTRLDFRLYRMDRKTFRQLNGENTWRAWDAFRPDERDLVRRWSKKVSAPLNETRTTGTAVESEEGAGLAPGLYYLEVTAPEIAEGKRSSRIMMVVSRLNLTLKQSQTEALVWATDLKSGRVVADLPVSFWSEFSNLGQGKTDEDGVVQIEYAKRDTWQPIFVFAGEEGEDDFAVTMNRWDSGISPWEFNLPAESYSEPYSAYFYTDRAIYRPGQTVYFKGVLRTDDDAHYGLPKNVESLEVVISDDQGKELYKEKLPLSEMGTLHGELTLSEEASLGYYSISSRLGDQYFGTSFQVAEYRKPEFQVVVETDRDQYVQGDEIAVNVQATYYFGGPVTDADVHWTVLTNDYFFHWTGRDRYDFTDYDWSQYRYYGPYGEFVTEGDGTTDEQGRFTFKVPADIADKILSQVYTIEATVTDVNDQQVASRTEAIVHKGLFYIGLAPQAYVGKVGEEQKVDIIAVNWDSEPVPKQDLTVVFYRHKWYSVREEGEDGRFYWRSTVEDTPVLTTTVTTDKEGKAVAAFTPEEGGVYKIAAYGEDEQGNEVRSSTYLWVSGYKFINWRRENHDRIDLVTDKKSYNVGDTAQILIPSPYAGPVKALLTIERGHIMEHKLLTLETNSELIEIPIRSEYAPNVYVSVVIIKGMDETEPLGSFKIGYAALSVSTEEKELKLAIKPDKDMEAGEHYGPRETVTYDIQVTDHRGKGVEAELSLHLVDLSVLALADMPGADIVEHFWRERSLGVWTGASLVLSVDRLNLQVAPEAKGGGGGPAGEGIVRRRFPDTAYWNPAVLTDKDGKAQVSVELPDNLTTWRLGAKAITADTQVGLTDVDIISTKDLLVRPVAPRFFVIGDKAELAAIVHNNSAKAIEVEVALEAEGVEVKGGVQTVEVPAHDKVRVGWPTVVQNTEEAKLLFSAQGGGLSDAIEIVLPVYRYSTPEVVATAGQVKENERRVEVVALPRRYDPTQGELTVEVDPSLAAGMRDGLKYLEHFPYECIEQTVSRFLPNVMTYRALKDLGVENKELETKLPQQVSVGLQRIYAWQRYDGGWGWWLADESNPYLTAYVLFGLNEARRAGFAVEEDVMERAAGFLRDNFIRPTDIRAPYQGNAQAFILYVLAEYGEGDLGRTVALYQQRRLLSNYGKAYLAMALDILDPEEKTRVDSLLSDLTSAAIVSATGAHWEEEVIDYWTMNTNTRSTAIVLDAFARLAPESGLAPNAVRWLMVARKEGHWETTQETVWSIIALTDWMVATGELEADYSYQITLNGETIMEGVADKDNLDEPQKIQVEIADLLQDVSNQVALERLEPTADQTGKGRLWYSMYLRYFLPVEDVKALNRGVIVARQYTLVDDPDKFVDGAQVGDVIKVKLTVIAPNDLHYVVVEDPLPAGCEAIDTSLKTTSIVGEAPQVHRLTDRMWDWGWGWWWFSHTELRDEKVVLFSTYLRKGTYEYTYLMRASVPGEFLVMPTVAYEMYFPEVFGRSDGGKFTVRASE